MYGDRAPEEKKGAIKASFNYALGTSCSSDKKESKFDDFRSIIEIYNLNAE